MEESTSQQISGSERFILKFLAGTGFTVVLEFGRTGKLEEYEDKIKGAGLQCDRIAGFNPKFDEADLYMDLRSPVCVTQFDLEDWL